MHALEVRDTEIFHLLLKEKVSSMGYGIRLINSTRADFQFKETNINAIIQAGGKKTPSCKKFSVKLPCGK